MIQAIIFIKTVLKYYAPLLGAVGQLNIYWYNAPSNSSDISFQDLFVRNSAPPGAQESGLYMVQNGDCESVFCNIK
jgi:hypothetical protein